MCERYYSAVLVAAEADAVPQRIVIPLVDEPGSEDGRASLLSLGRSNTADESKKVSRCAAVVEIRPHPKHQADAANGGSGEAANARGGE